MYIWIDKALEESRIQL